MPGAPYSDAPAYYDDAVFTNCALLLAGGEGERPRMTTRKLLRALHGNVLVRQPVHLLDTNQLSDMPIDHHQRARLGRLALRRISRCKVDIVFKSHLAYEAMLAL